MLLISAARGFLLLFAILAAVTFGAAGTIGDGQIWATLAVFFGSAIAITVWLWFHDRALLQRRMKAGPGSESDRLQNLLQGLAGLVFLGVFAFPGLDRRFGWSQVPPAVSLVGQALIAIGFGLVFLTFRANTFTAGTIEIAEDHHVVDSGPYAVVRHPMYSGALVMFVGIPLALGSWWGLVPAAMILPVLVWRLIREEAFLLRHLAGYDGYRRRVRCRLIPMLW